MAMVLIKRKGENQIHIVRWSSRKATTDTKMHVITPQTRDCPAWMDAIETRRTAKKKTVVATNGTPAAYRPLRN